MAIKTYVVDTSAYSSFYRGEPEFLSYFSDCSIIMPLIVVGELRYGFSLGSKQHENEQNLITFLNLPQVQTISISDKTTHCYADIFKHLRLKGTPIGTNDIWIAALCIENNLPLLTLDNDFSHIDNLHMISNI